ncbi:MAG: DUF4112 domain-containing protein [Chthoniobacterales bacterium]
MTVKTEPIEFEVLPPKRDRDVPELSRLIAWLLDDLIRIPGTNFRIGLDPIIGLIPGLGDGSTAVVSSVILLHGLRAGVPRIVLVRMALNVLINSLVGAIPGVGDLFSAVFKSNRRNVELLDRHASSTRRASTAADWIFVGVLIGFVLLFAVAVSVAAVYVTYKVFKLLAAI